MLATAHENLLEAGNQVQHQEKLIIGTQNPAKRQKLLTGLKKTQRQEEKAKLKYAKELDASEELNMTGSGKVAMLGRVLDHQ